MKEKTKNDDDILIPITFGLFIGGFAILFLIGAGWTDNGKEVVLTTKNDSVGIGTDNPSATLDVNGTTKTKELYLTETIWEDLRFPATVLKTQGASNIPDFENLQDDLYTYAFDADTMEQAYLTMQLPHSRKDNSDLKAHFHWTNLEFAPANVIWCMEYSCSNINDVFPNSKYSCVSQGAYPFMPRHQMTGEIIIPNNLTASSMCMVRIFRNATQTEDNFGYDAYLLEFDIHYQVEKLGEKI